MGVGSAKVRKYLEEVCVWLKPVRGDFAVGKHGQTVRHDMIGEQAAVGVAAGLAGGKTQHVGQNLCGIDQGQGRLAGVAPHPV